MNHELIDHYDRVITSLRISITQRCNLNCIYCHEEGEEANPEREISLDTTAKTDFEEIIMALPDFKNVSQYMVDINSLEKTLEPRAAFKLQTKLEKL